MERYYGLPRFGSVSRRAKIFYPLTTVPDISIDGENFIIATIAKNVEVAEVVLWTKAVFENRIAYLIA